MVQSALTSHQNWVVAVQWSPNREHQLLSGSYEFTKGCISYPFINILLRVWDVRSSRLPLFTITAHEGKVLCLDWSLPQVGNRLFIQALF